jgi:hypothetical protein
MPELFYFYWEDESSELIMTYTTFEEMITLWFNRMKDLYDYTVSEEQLDKYKKDNEDAIKKCEELSKIEENIDDCQYFELSYYEFIDGLLLKTLMPIERKLSDNKYTTVLCFEKQVKDPRSERIDEFGSILCDENKDFFINGEVRLRRAKPDSA